MVIIQSTTKTSEVALESILEAEAIQAMLLKYGIKVEVKKV